MSILTKEMRDEFIHGLRPVYAKSLPSKSIKLKNDIMYAATNLYAYGTPFVNIGKSRQPHYGVSDIPHLEAILVPFVDEIWMYFNGRGPHSTQADFDCFHKLLCNNFLGCIRAAGKYSHTYGSAQKMVNILFKYLACFKDAASYKDWFTYCHVALDRFTYNGYRLPFYRDVVYPSVHNCSPDLLTPWSQMTDIEYTSAQSEIISYIRSTPKTYNDYLDICHTHLGVLSRISPLSKPKDYVLTPFEAEFFIWTIAKACNNRCATRGAIKTILSKIVEIKSGEEKAHAKHVLTRFLLLKGMLDKYTYSTESDPVHSKTYYSLESIKQDAEKVCAEKREKVFIWKMPSSSQFNPRAFVFVHHELCGTFVYEDGKILFLKQ